MTSLETAKEAKVEAGTDLVHDPALRQRLRFRRERDHEGEVLFVETWVDPGGGVTPHVHQAMEERFKVISGSVSFLSGRKWVTAGPGETVVVPAGARHAYRNNGDQEAHMVCEARPPSSLQEFLEEAAALGRAGRFTKRNAIPKGPGALLDGIELAERYSDMVVLGFPPMPPERVQRLLFPPLARFAARRRGKPGA